MILSLVDILVKIIDRMILLVGEYLGRVMVRIILLVGGYLGQDNGQNDINCWWISW